MNHKRQNHISSAGLVFFHLIGAILEDDEVVLEATILIGISKQIFIKKSKKYIQNAKMGNYYMFLES